MVRHVLAATIRARFVILQLVLFQHRFGKHLLMCAKVHKVWVSPETQPRIYLLFSTGMLDKRKQNLHWSPKTKTSNCYAEDFEAASNHTNSKTNRRSKFTFLTHQPISYNRQVSITPSILLVLLAWKWLWLPNINFTFRSYLIYLLRTYLLN